MRVAELATHINSSLPGDRSRARPGRFVINTFQVRTVAMAVIELIGVSGFITGVME
jgi:hypothetical protein